MRLAAVFAVLLTACYTPPELDEGLLCDSENDNACPEGQSCGADGVCYWGESYDCGASLECPDPSGGRVSICGQILDIGTSDEVRDVGADGGLCDPTDPQDSGACALTVSFLDAAAYFNDAAGTPALATEEIAVDDCGRFRGLNIQRPVSGAVIVHVDDPPAVLVDDDKYVPTVMVFTLGPDEAEAGTSVVATRRQTDVDWMTSAGNPFGGGTTFADKGAHMGVFFDGDKQVEGVTFTGGGVARPAQDYYFSDVEVWERTTVNPSRPDTGPNGAVLVVDSILTDHSGEGAEPAGCQWPSFLYGVIPGVIHYAEYYAVDSSNTDNLCPQ